jgi:phosphoserine phosphatase RsbU/P
MSTSTSRLQVSTFKLNALLAITQAINENLSVNDLLNRYVKILKEDLNIGKILIFKAENSWECILDVGLKDGNYKKIDIEKDLLCFDEITFVTSSPVEVLGEFDIVIPVQKNNHPFAYVLIGDIDEEGEGISPTIKHLHFVQTLSNIIMVAIENIRLFNESLQQEAMKKELELASKMQNMLIPDKSALPKNEKIYITSFYKPHLEVGGDYYDCMQLSENEIGFCIADVSGKGISAAILMSNFQANLRALFSTETTLESLVEKLNDRVMQSAKGEKFITLFVAKYDLNLKELSYVNAGHNPPVLYEINKSKITLLESGCVGVGMLNEIPLIKTGKIVIESPAKLFCYTDGLVEIMFESGITYGSEVIEKALANKDDVDKNIHDIMKIQGVLDDNASIFDDITIIAAEFYS